MNNLRRPALNRFQSICNLVRQDPIALLPQEKASYSQEYPMPLRRRLRSPHAACACTFLDIALSGGREAVPRDLRDGRSPGGDVGATGVGTCGGVIIRPPIRHGEGTGAESQDQVCNRGIDRSGALQKATKGRPLFPCDHAFFGCRSTVVGCSSAPPGSGTPAGSPQRMSRVQCAGTTCRWVEASG